MTWTKLTLALISISALIGCSAPKTYLDTYIVDKGYIPYVLQVDNSRVGTFYEGSNKNLQLVQRTTYCMPEGSREQFIESQPVSLPDEYQKVTLKFDAEADNVLSSGSSSVSLNLEASHVKEVVIEFGEAKVKSFVKHSLLSHYKNGMSDVCKELFEDYAFVNKSLRVESMKFSFLSDTGAKIDLSGNIDDIVNIKAGVEKRLINRYTLEILTPKAIGYNMARLTDSIDLEYATKLDSKDHWVFKPASELLWMTPPAENLVLK